MDSTIFAPLRYKSWATKWLHDCTSLFCVTNKNLRALSSLSLVVFTYVLFILTPSTGASAMVCSEFFLLKTETFNDSEPSLDFQKRIEFLRENELPREIFSATGFEVFRGISLDASDLQIVQMFSDEYGFNSVRKVQTPKQEQQAYLELPTNLSSLSPQELAPYVLQHASGISIQNSLFVSTTFDLGVATYFAFQGKGSRHLILHLHAPPDSINVTAFARQRPFQERGEAEVMIPLKIPSQNMMQILEVNSTPHGPVVMGRWIRQNSKVVYEPVDALVLPHPRTRSVFRLSH